MVMVFGTSKRRYPVGAYKLGCAACNRDSVQIAAIEKRAFTLFWIPFVPLGSGKLLVCGRCGATVKTAAIPDPRYEIPPEQIQSTLAALVDRDAASSISTCPTCNRTARFIEKYSRYYCDTCKTYLKKT
jgi:hypothetical protein